MTCNSLPVATDGDRNTEPKRTKTNENAYLLINFPLFFYCS